MQFEISRYLDTRYQSKKDLTYPVTIRIYHDRKTDLLKTGISLTEQEFADIHAPRVKSGLSDALKKITLVESIANDYVTSARSYNIKQLRLQVTNTNLVFPSTEHHLNNHSQNVFEYFQRKIDLCKKGKQYGSAEAYQSTMNVFKRYLKTSEFEFNFFSVERLREIEMNMMESMGITISTVGKHARNLRSIFNMALNEGAITQKQYPFGRYGYIIPEVTKAKKALSRTMLKQIMCYQPKNYYQGRALAFFIFSYFGNGMNLKDIALLRYKDLNNGILYYFRKKTKNTSAQLKTIRVLVTEEMRKVINEYGNPFSGNNTYIFPILQDGLSPERVDTKIHTRNKSINNTLKRISRLLEFDHHITLGMSRHSFANALKQEGVDFSFIQEALGHGSPAITEHYMNSFEDSITTSHIQKLKNFYEAEELK
jgi:integrase/recombinase XerD